MDEEPIAPRAYSLGDDLSRLSVRELEELRQALLGEAERIAAEIAKKDASKVAAANAFKL